MMTEADIVLLAEKMAKVAQPQSSAEWSVLGVFLLFLLVVVAALAYGGRALLQKLLEIHGDMRALIVQLTGVVATNNHALAEAKEATQETANVVDALRQEIHTSNVLREDRSSPAARGVQS